MNLRSHILRLSTVRAIAAVCAAVFVTSVPSVARAAGVVGADTAETCIDAALDAALANGGLVTFNCGSAPVTIDISIGTGTKFILADTTIDGAGLITINADSGTPSAEVFRVSASVNLTVRNLVFHGNKNLLISDGINNLGSLTVANCTFTGFGGVGITSSGTTTVADCTFTDNGYTDGTFTFIPGGIINLVGSLTVANSTFMANVGAIANDDGTLTVTNSTFIDNIAAILGGRGSALLRNTVIADTYLDDNCVGPDITDGGHNLESGTSCGFSTANGSLNNTNPQLDPAGLQDNGGPTQTVALCTAAGVPAGCTAASPAIDAGDQTVCAAAPVNNRDQRGFVRPGAGHTDCSIGAFEADATPAEVCVGDCNTTGRVTVDELVKGVNIALGSATLDQCQAFDCNGNGHVTVDCLVQAVNHALNGCGVGT